MAKAKAADGVEVTLDADMFCAQCGVRIRGGEVAVAAGLSRIHPQCWHQLDLTAREKFSRPIAPSA